MPQHIYTKKPYPSLHLAMAPATYYPREAYKQLPTSPGVYQFYNTQNELLYVGKATNLRQRVSSYFMTKNQPSLKVRRMAAHITKIACILVNNPYEALLLENTLIKQQQPKYNVLLKDDKTYPYLCITNERFPRLLATRTLLKKKGHRYYGPFTSTQALRRILDFIRSLYPLRTCTYNLSKVNIERKKFKVCLEYHLGNCLGPCEGKQAEATYLQDIAQVELLLKGDIKAMKKTLQQQIKNAATQLNFEQAQIYQQRLEAITHYKAKSIVANPALGDLDVCTLVPDGLHAFANYMQIREGMVLSVQSLHMKCRLDEPPSALLALAVAHFSEQQATTAKHLLTNLPLAHPPPGIKAIVPRIGDKRHLVALSLKNAQALRKKMQVPLELPPGQRTLRILQQDLQLNKLPRHIECFDNSNLYGQHAVAGMVCFKDGKPFKKGYRHFHIQTVTGPDDYASMQEVVYRRYASLSTYKESLPDLVVIDGGKGQLNAAWQALRKLNLHHQIPIVAIAKRLEMLYRPKDPYPLHLSKQSPSLKLLQRIRNEAHRFAITFHRSNRAKKSLQTRLTTIKGIGPATVARLHTHFPSLEAIAKAPIAELAQYIGHKKALLVKHGLAK